MMVFLDEDPVIVIQSVGEAASVVTGPPPYWKVVPTRVAADCCAWAQCTNANNRLAAIDADDNLLATLSEVTGWNRQGDRVTFTGPKPLRFLLLTN